MRQRTVRHLAIDPPITTAFLDRDGVVNRNPANGRYVTNWGEFHFIPGSVAALALLKAARIRTIIVTNQRGIATGRMERSDVDEVHRQMMAELTIVDANVDAVFVCPHDIGECDCRKPGVGLFEQAR